VQAIHARRALVGGSFVGPVTIAVSGGLIQGVQPASTGARAADIRLDSGFLTAGLVDLQINGSYGVDFAAARPDQWQMVSQALTATGCTAYVPTFITAPPAEMGACLDRTFQAQQAQTPGVPQARILGAHLEGPFISAQRAGAHDAGQMLDPGPDELAGLLATPQRRAALRILTLAPERQFALDAIRALTAAGVLVSVGHTDADGACASDAAEAGARLVTHLFNAMGGLDHRSSTLPGRVLADRRFSLSLVADLHHVDADLVRLVLAAAADRVVLVTDAVAAAGAPPGTYGLGGTQVTTTSEDPLPRRSDGVLAGSVLRMDQAVRNLVGLGVGLEQSLLAASRNPANALARPDLGRLSSGASADLVWWSDELAVRQTWVGGRTCLPAGG
jgi:N-acetylglucosamine-6-phosphate deacetylase